METGLDLPAPLASVGSFNNTDYQSVGDLKVLDSFQVDQQQRVDKLGFLNSDKGQTTEFIKLSRFITGQMGH